MYRNNNKKKKKKNCWTISKKRFQPFEYFIIRNIVATHEEHFERYYIYVYKNLLEIFYLIGINYEFELIEIVH